MFAIFATKCERFTLEINNDSKEIPTDLNYKRINDFEHLEKNCLTSTVNKQTPSKNIASTLNTSIFPRVFSIVKQK
jgi:hypothetical protein